MPAVLIAIVLFSCRFAAADSSGTVVSRNDTRSTAPASQPSPEPAAGEKITGFLFPADHVRALIQSPDPIEPDKPTRLVIYLLPNGATPEQTLGCTCTCALDWHYGIQHIAAQTRRLRQLVPGENIVTACLGNDLRSWPAWRREHPETSGPAILNMVRQLARTVPDGSRVDLVAHSGGGSFIFGLLNARSSIPDFIHSITFLDATYSYSNDDGHGRKLLEWLGGDPHRRLVTVAYDDRHVTFKGKPIVSATGGTWRSVDRMMSCFDKVTTFSETRTPDFTTSTGLNGQVVFLRKPNPENKILHTVLVERNGFLFGELGGQTAADPNDRFWAETPAYRKLISLCRMP